MRFGITFKLTLSFIIAIIPFYIFSAYWNYKYHIIADDKYEYNVHLSILNDISRLSIHLNLSIQPLYRYMTSGNITERDNYLAKFADIMDLYHSVKKTDSKHQNVIALYHELEGNLKKFNDINVIILGYPHQYISQHSREIYRNQFRPLRNIAENIIHNLDHIRAASNIEMKELLQENEAALSQIEKSLFISWGGSILFCLIIGYFISRHFSRSISSVGSAVRKIGSGDIMVRLHATAKDELGDLIESFNVMAEQLQTITVSKEYFDSILQNMNDSIIVISQDGNILNINHAASFMLLCKEEEITGSKFSRLFPRGSFHWNENLKRIIEHTGLIQKESLITSPSGRTIPVAYSITKMAGDYELVDRYVCVIQDITYRKRAEETIRHLSQEMIRLQEDERGRISREIHDNMGGSLQALKIMVYNFITANPGKGDAGDDYSGIMSYIDTIINDARKISRSLSPVGFKAMGLPKAIISMVETMNISRNMDIRVDVDKLDNFFPGNWDINLYRMVQESMTNIIKHSGATGVSIRVSLVDDTLTMTIKDNGTGIDMKAPGSENSHAHGLGLLIMNERAGLLNGKFDFHSRKGKGTVITIEIPRNI